MNNEWFLIALIAPALWSLVIIVDDNLLSKAYDKSPLFGTIISGYFGILPVLAILIWPITIPPISIILLGLLTGFIIISSFWFYFKSLLVDSPSVITAIWNLYPALVPFLAFIFLKEQLSFYQYIGFGLILLSSIGISVVDIKKFKLSQAFYLMSAASILLAVDAIIQKYIYTKVEFWSGYIFVSLGMVIAALFYSASSKEGRSFFRSFKSKFRKFFVIFVLSELLNIIAFITSNLAVSMGPVSLVKIMEGVQPLYIILFAAIFYRFFPSYLRDATAENKFVKITFMIIMVVGLYFIYKTS